MSELLSREFLNDIGVVLKESEYGAFSDTYEKVLNDRVHEAIVQALTTTQLEQLSLYRAKSDEALQEWLKENVPEIKELIESVIEALLEEIMEQETSLA